MADIDHIVSDQELVQKTLEGCQRSYSELFARYWQGLGKALSIRCSDSELCEDVLQEAFVRAYMKLEQYNPEYSFGAWLTTIARNYLVDHTRKTKNYPQQSSVSNELAWEGRDPEQSFIDMERKEAIMSTIAQMSESYATIFEMRFFRGMSYPEIANDLAMPIGTVKTQIYRARKEFISLSGIDSRGNVPSGVASVFF